MVFKLIRPNKNPFRKPEFQLTEIILITLTVLALIQWTEIHLIILSLIAISLIIITKFFSRRLYPDWVKRKDIIGQIDFFDKEIIISKNTTKASLHLDNYQSLYLRHNYIKGIQIGRGTLSNGIARIILTKADNEEETMQFLIESKAQFKEFKTILKKYYKSGLKIKEALGKNEFKTILLEPDAKYSDSELKDLKQELGLRTFYN